MKNKKDISYYKKLNYNVILKKIDNNYYLFIPELSLIVEGKSLDEAHGRLETEKENCFKKAADLDALDIIREPGPVIFRKKLFIDLAMFFTKTLIVVCICSIAFIGSLPLVNVFLIQGLAKTTKALVKEFPRKIYNKLDNMSDEEKEEMKLKLRKLVQDIKPFIDEVRVLSKDENTKTIVKP